MLVLWEMLRALFLAPEDEDRGATMVEYALIVFVIALVVAVGAGIFGEELSDFFSTLWPYE